MKIKRIALLLSACILFVYVFGFSSCTDDNTEESSTGYEYRPSASDETTDEAQTGEFEKKISIDNTWKRNFRVNYRYYNPEQSITTMNIQEKKSSNAFTVQYIDTHSILYYKSNGNDTDYYVIIEDQDEQVHSVLQGKKFSSLSSMFMKLSVVDADLPSQNNVLYMYEEEVAGRNCHKYIQRAYSEGKLTESVYLWIDAEYGFVAKCEAYDASNVLTVMWEIEEFVTGTLKDEDVFLDLSDYSFREEVG